MRISIAVSAQAATAMSAGEGLDEAAKDAADIAAFFKSGKSGRGESGSRRATVALSVWSVVVCHIVAKKDKKNPLTGFMGEMRAARLTYWRDAHS